MELIVRSIAAGNGTLKGVALGAEILAYKVFRFWWFWEYGGDYCRD
jgi:hypothetical protein